MGSEQPAKSIDEHLMKKSHCNLVLVSFSPYLFSEHPIVDHLSIKDKAFICMNSSAFPKLGSILHISVKCT